MKAKLTGTILNVEKVGGSTRLVLNASGKVDTTNISAQETNLEGTITLKTIIANKMKIGAIVTVVISDEESNEGSY